MLDLVAGIDEAGMGTLAGPVTAAVVILRAGEELPHVRDSKKMTVTSREDVIDLIHQKALYSEVLVSEPAEVDKEGLSKVWVRLTKELAEKANGWLVIKGQPAEKIIDGNRFILDCPDWKPIVKADDKYLAVSAASILAKYMQTCILEGFAKKFPAYNFEKHHGYGTADHLKALETNGPCPIHRMTYAPVKRILSLRAGLKPG